MSRDEATLRSHEEWLCALTGIPTAAGRERRVIDWIEQWARDRDWITIERDRCGNLTLRNRNAGASATPPVYFTGHLDHPAFVVDEIVGEGTIAASFRGGVLAPYFVEAPVRAHAGDGSAIDGVVTSYTPASPPDRLFQRCTIDLDAPCPDIRTGDIVTWRLPDPSIVDGFLNAPVCDDLAAVAAALAAFDQLRDVRDRDVRVLLTLAEEVGFVGAIAACRDKTMPPGSRIIALENSRAVDGAAQNEGPIVRVGDRMSVFSPSLTGAVAKVAQSLTGIPERKPGDHTPVPESKFKWQRRLMPGGSCEATAYTAYGYEATCVCLALENYHNMSMLDEANAAILAGDETHRGVVAPERIAVADFHGLVDLLIACGGSIASVEPMVDRLEKMYEERAFVLRGADANAVGKEKR